MAIILTAGETLRERTATALAAITFNYNEQRERFLRRQFDNALIDATALAVIQLAKSEGFTELAEQMEADFRAELNQEV